MSDADPPEPRRPRPPREPVGPPAGTPPYTKYTAGRRTPRQPRNPPNGRETPDVRGSLGRSAVGAGGVPPTVPPQDPGRRDPGPPPRGPRRRRRVPGARAGGTAARWTLCWVARRALRLAFCWVLISVIIFMVSAQIHQTTGASGTLGGAGFPLWSPNTILVLGSDARPKGTKEAGAGGPSRSDSIMLLRIGGGASSKLSIPRDTLVPIPGHGLDKINAAYAYGGVPLSVRTIEGWLGIKINHVIEIDFQNFPRLIDAMGGVTYTGGCVVSKINGGFKNGGYTLRLRAGRTHIDGKQALALARTRKNLCNPREDDLARARRQQKLVSAMKSRMFSPGAFIRLPWVAWQAPQALRSDLGGPGMAGLVGGMLIGGGTKTQVLMPTGTAVSPGGGAALTVDDAHKQRAVARFMAG